jgi:hypothetical protein
MMNVQCRQFPGKVTSEPVQQIQQYNGIQSAAQSDQQGTAGRNHRLQTLGNMR